MANCAVCRQDIDPGTECSRCGSSNKNLEDVSLAYFSSFWGVLSMLLIFPPLFMLLPGLISRVDRALQPIASIRIGGPIALLNTLIIAFYIYSLRDALYYYTLRRRFQTEPGRSLAFWGLFSFVIALFLAFFLSFGVTSKDSIIGSPGSTQLGPRAVLAYGSVMHLLVKLTMTGCLIFVFASFALAAGVMAAYEYGEHLKEHCPDPIFLNERLLLKVVLRAVREHLEISESTPETAESLERIASERVGDLKERLSVSEMKRLVDGGISLTLHNEGELAERGDFGIREDRTWYVEADRWGHLSRVDEKSLRVTKIIEQVLPPIDAVLAQVRKLLGFQVDLIVRELERLDDGGMALLLVQKGEAAPQDPNWVPQRGWLVELDEEGRVTKIKEQDVRPNKGQGTRLSEQPTQPRGARTWPAN